MDDNRIYLVYTSTAVSLLSRILLLTQIKAALEQRGRYMHQVAGATAKSMLSGVQAHDRHHQPNRQRILSPHPFAGRGHRRRHPCFDDGSAAGLCENGAIRRRLSGLAAWVGELRQLQIVHRALVLQIRRRIGFGKRLVQDLGQGLIRVIATCGRSSGKPPQFGRASLSAA